MKDDVKMKPNNMKKQCKLRINVNGEKDHYYFCVKQKGHGGYHRIRLREETVLLTQLFDAMQFYKMTDDYPKFIKKVKKATKSLNFE